MKRLAVLITAMIAALCICACAKGSSEKVTGPVTETVTEAVTEANAYSFSVNGVRIHMNENTAELLKKLGEYVNYSESSSCAFDGLDKIYSYSGFDLYTYPVKDEDFVNSVYFTDETVKTEEGIGIGDTVEKMKETYGTDYTEEFDVYTYTKGDSQLQFLTTDGIIEAVDYQAVVKSE